MSCGPTQYRSVAHWQYSANGEVPFGSVQAGDDSGEPLYVARAHQGGDNIPGKLQPSHGCCYVSWSGEEHRHQVYEVLCDPLGGNFDWVYTTGGNIPSGAVQGGSTVDGEPLYIGRHIHEGTMTVGKVHPSHNCLYIPYGGSEHSYHDYEVLVVRTVRF